MPPGFGLSGVFGLSGLSGFGVSGVFGSSGFGVSGAGSGKTKVLTTKIAYAVLEKNVSEYEILAITFTIKRERK